MQADDSTLMPFLAKELLDNRKQYAPQAAELSEEKLFEQTPQPAATSATQPATASSTNAKN